MWQTLHILVTISLLLSCIGMVCWVFRPSSKRTYDEQSMIPISDDDKKK